MRHIGRCLFFALFSASISAQAGNAPIAIGSADGLGLSDGFNTVTTSATRLTNVVTVFQTTTTSNRIANPLGECIAVAPEKLAVISNAVTVAGAEAQQARELLEDQISGELEGEPVSIEILDYSAGAYVEAADSANQFVADLDSELLETAMYSPTLMVILNSLGARMNLLQDQGIDKPACAAQTDTAATEETLFAQDKTDPSSIGLIKISLSP